MERIRIKIINLKLKIHDYFLIEKSMNQMMKIAVKYFLISISLNDIYYGNKNPKQFKKCVSIYILMWLMSFNCILFVLSDDMYSLIDSPSVPRYFRTFLLLLSISSVMILTAKTDLLLGEIKSNLDQFKIFYYLINNIKSKHKLSKQNYKKISILSRIIQTGSMDYAVRFIIVFGSLLFIKIAIQSKNLVLQFYLIICGIPVAIIAYFEAALLFFIFYILLYYYKLVFDQISNRFVRFCNRKSSVINKKTEIELIKLIKQHNLVSVEMNGINLLFRRTAAFIFIVFSFIKIISFYLIMHSNDIIFTIILVNVVSAFSIFGLGLSYLFSLQIKLAHQSYQTIHSIICKYKIRFYLKMKVS